MYHFSFLSNMTSKNYSVFYNVMNKTFQIHNFHHALYHNQDFRI